MSMMDKIHVGSIIAIPPEDFAGNIELANTRVEYLRLLGIGASYSPDLDMFIVNFGGDNDGYIQKREVQRGCGIQC